jgi:hypothetical protein
MYAVEALVGTLTNFSCTQNTVDRPYSYLLALKPFKFTYMEIKTFENSFLPYKVVQVLGMLFISHITHGNE